MGVPYFAGIAKGHNLLWRKQRKTGRRLRIENAFLIGLAFAFLVLGCKGKTKNGMDSRVNCRIPSPGMTITQSTVLCPGVFQVGKDDNPAVTIIGNHIKLKCNDTYIAGNGKGEGIEIKGEYNSIEGCVLADFNNGISANSSGSGTKISNVTVKDATRHFIQLIGSDKYELFDVEIANTRLLSSKTGGGLVCGHCVNSTIRDVYYFNDQSVVESPFFLGECRNSSIERNTIISLGGKACNGIWMVNCRNLKINSNTVIMRGNGDGSHTPQSAGNTFSYNEFDIESGSRIFALENGDDGNIFYGNVFRGGMVIDRAANTTWCRNGIGNSFLDGASFQGSDLNQGTCQSR